MLLGHLLERNQPDVEPYTLLSSPFCHPGADGAGVLRALAQAGVWNVFAPVQPTGWRPPALSLGLLLC